MSETPTLPEFSGDGGERIVDGNDGCYAIIPLAGGSEVIGCYRVKTVYLKAGN
jgi:phage-related minor tail protein